MRFVGVKLFASSERREMSRDDVRFQLMRELSTSITYMSMITCRVFEYDLWKFIRIEILRIAKWFERIERRGSEEGETASGKRER